MEKNNQAEVQWVPVSRGFKCENGAIMDPLPPGPYIIKRQFTEYRLSQSPMTWETALSEAHESEKLDKFPENFQTAAVYANDNGMVICVAYHFDSSD